VVEDVFLILKNVLDLRPLWHKCDDNLEGHVLLLASRCFKATGFRPRVGTNSPSMPRANPGVHAFLTAKLSNLGYDK